MGGLAKVLTLITCTGDRLEAFALCEKYMARQSVKWDEWIVVDDGEIKVGCTLGQKHIKLQANTHDSFRRNMYHGLRHAKGDKILFIEDDDWYAPIYLQAMSTLLDQAKLVGQARAKYFNVSQGCYRVFNNYQHASLCQTGIHSSLVPIAMKHLCNKKESASQLDGNLWIRSGVHHTDKYLMMGSLWCVGMKGMPGRKGLGHSHEVLEGFETNGAFEKLSQWIGQQDADVYKAIHVRMKHGGSEQLQRQDLQV